MALFSGLSEKLNHIFSKLTKHGKLTELEIKTAMREVRIALLEADVNISVVKEFVQKVSERAVGEAMEAIVEPVSLYDSVYGEDDDKMYVIDKLADDDEESEGWIENMALKEALGRLAGRERDIIMRRYYNGKTQMEIAEEIGISQAQVSRLEKSAIKKMRKYM